jgi:dTDP-4-dehydrorhamnose reductase
VEAFGRKSRIIYISTDYVFDGQRGNYTEEDTPTPATQYGRTKLAGECEGLRLALKKIIIVRTAAIYDLRANFLKFLLDKLSNGESVECFSDVIYSPTYYEDFLAVLERVSLFPGGRKIYHACGESVSRYSFACQFAESFGFDHGLIKPISGEGQRLFLFPNLSLNGQITQKELCTTAHSHKQALLELVQQRLYETT